MRMWPRPPMIPSSSNSPISAISQDQCNHRAQQIELKWLSVSYKECYISKKLLLSHWALLDFFSQLTVTEADFSRKSHMFKMHYAFCFKDTLFFLLGILVVCSCPLTLKFPNQCSQARHGSRYNGGWVDRLLSHHYQLVSQTLLYINTYVRIRNWIQW